MTHAVLALYVGIRWNGNSYLETCSVATEYLVVPGGHTSVSKSNVFNYKTKTHTLGRGLRQKPRTKDHA